MHDIKFVHVLKPSHDILEEDQCFSLTQFSLLLQIVPEITLLAKLSDDVHIITGLVDIQQSYDILILQSLHDFYFTVDVLEVVLISEDALVDDLHCCRCVLSQESA